MRGRHQVRLRGWIGVGVLLCGLGTVIPCPAQDVASHWIGEWGDFEQGGSGDSAFPLGRGLSVSGCDGKRCAISLRLHGKAANGDAAGYLEVQTSTTGIAHLMFEKQEHCALQLTLDSVAAQIAVRPGPGDCSYFLTPGGSFVGSYPLHTRDTYVSENVPACFAATEPAMLALCTSKTLADEETRWNLLFLEVSDLRSAGDGASDAELRETAMKGLLRPCDSAAAPGDCMMAALEHSVTELNARKAAWLDSVTAPGDAGAAEKAIAAVAGSYRHSFENGDVSGDHFLSTNRLEITAVSNSSIHFSVSLEFYNGHECSLDGTASYKRAGLFADQIRSQDPKFPMCVLEIVPGEQGVTLADPTGGCKMMSCGERGGYNGTAFAFKDRR